MILIKRIIIIIFIIIIVIISSTCVKPSCLWKLIFTDTHIRPRRQCQFSNCLILYYNEFLFTIKRNIRYHFIHSLFIFIPTCMWVVTALTVKFRLLGCFCTPRRKRGIRENQSTATVPVLKRPPDQFAVSQLLDGNVCVYARVVCMLGRARGRITRALIGWLPFRTLSTPYVNLAE